MLISLMKSMVPSVAVPLPRVDPLRFQAVLSDGIDSLSYFLDTRYNGEHIQELFYQPDFMIDPTLRCPASLVPELYPVIRVHPLTAQLFTVRKSSFYAIILHEIAHLSQVKSYFDYMASDGRLKPIHDALLFLFSTIPNTKIRESAILGSGSYTTVLGQSRPGARIVNLAMDIEVNQIVEGIIPGELEVINAWLSSVFWREALPDASHPPVAQTLQSFRTDFPFVRCAESKPWTYYFEQYINAIANCIYNYASLGFSDSTERVYVLISRYVQPEVMPDNHGGIRNHLPTISPDKIDQPTQYEEYSMEAFRERRLSSVKSKGVGGGSGNKFIRIEFYSDPPRHEQALAIEPLYSNLHTTKPEMRRTFTRPNRRKPHIQGIPYTYIIEHRIPQVVCVVDTSGSVFFRKYFEEVAAILFTLFDTEKLGPVYTFDVGLRRLTQNDFSTPLSIDFIGFGGTQFGKSEIDKILGDVGVDSGLDIVMISDFDTEEVSVDGDDRVKIHKIRPLCLEDRKKIGGHNQKDN